MGRKSDLHLPLLCALNPIDHSFRAPKNTFCKSVWLLCGFLAALPFLDQHRHDHRPVPRGRNPSPLFQLRRIVAVVFYGAFIYFHQAGFPQDTDAGQNELRYWIGHNICGG